jgi:uncharacterized protein YbaR (Trm112 family)
LLNVLAESKEKFSLLICPNCRHNLEEIEIGKEIIGFCCSKCELVYPIKRGIPIVLAKGARNYELEYPLIREIRKSLSQGAPAILNYVNKTLDLIASRKKTSSWEWEDEQFWSREYSRENKNKTPKNWNDRIWQRELLARELSSRLSLKAKTILDLGCGEG